jgi:hypothetical protein
VLDTIHEIYDDEILVLNERNMEKLREYLSKDRILDIAGIPIQKRHKNSSILANRKYRKVHVTP